MFAQKKRARSANFSSEEKILIINIITKYKDVVENKKTDTVSLNEKTAAWNKITDEFNAISPNNIFRTPESIKKFFNNKKKEVRKIAAEEKKEITLTGGGIAQKFVKDSSHDLVLSLINKKSVYGLNNPFDSDSLPQPSCSNINEEISEGIMELNNMESYSDGDNNIIQNIETQIVYVDNVSRHLYYFWIVVDLKIILVDL